MHVQYYVNQQPRPFRPGLLKLYLSGSFLREVIASQCALPLAMTTFFDSAQLPEKYKFESSAVFQNIDTGRDRCYNNPDN